MDARLRRRPAKTDDAASPRTMDDEKKGSLRRWRIARRKDSVAAMALATLLYFVWPLSGVHWQSRSIRIRESAWGTDCLTLRSIRGTGSMQLPSALDEDFGSPQYNGMDAEFLRRSSRFQREILADEYERYAVARKAELNAMDERPDGLSYYYLDDEDVPANNKCRRNNWRSREYPTCNNFHETTLHRYHQENGMGLQPYTVAHRGDGSFRQSWLFQHGDDGVMDDFILKSMLFHHPFNYKMKYGMRQDAIIMERLSASPRIVDIFGYCGFSIFSEHMHGEVTDDMVPNSSKSLSRYGFITQEQLDEEQMDDVVSKNDLTVDQKLDYALVMAEASAEMHGFEGGLIVHGDIHPVQYLKDKDGNIKLNDFNNGEIVDFDPVEGVYCSMWRCYGGDYRPPEELKCAYAHEGIDVWPMGNHIYVLLTGLWPYYQYGMRKEKLKKSKIISGELPFVDDRWRTRSTIEGGLVKVMEQCWERDTSKRISIFDVVRQLRELKVLAAADKAKR